MLRVDTAGISHLYPNVRKALLGVGLDLTEVLDVMRVLERLIAASIERESKRLQVHVHALPTRTHVKVIDRRRLNPRASLPVEVVPRDMRTRVGRTDGAGRHRPRVVGNHRPTRDCGRTAGRLSL